MDWWRHLGFLKSIFWGFVIYCPGKFGINLRRKIYSRRFKFCGSDLVVYPGVLIDNHQHIRIGDSVTIDPYTIIRGGIASSENSVSGTAPECFLEIGNEVHIGAHCTIAFHGGVKVGNKCVIGAGSQIYSMSNVSSWGSLGRDYSLMPYSNSKYTAGTVDIGDNCWIALHCILMCGVRLGMDCFLASGSIVTSSLPDNAYLCRNGDIRHRFAANGRN